MNQRVRSAFVGHLASSFPELPTGLVSPFVDQKAASFVARRIETLSVYLQKLLNIDKVVHNVDLMIFLGIDPATGTARAQADEDGGDEEDEGEDEDVEPVLDK